jgi:hypothetical protein
MRTLLAVIAVATLAVTVSAHEGHDHRIMGTVATVGDMRLDVKGTDGTTSVVVLNESTKIMKAKETKTAADIKAGDRVVITATQGKDKDGKTIFVAKEVHLGTSSAPPATK